MKKKNCWIASGSGSCASACVKAELTGAVLIVEGGYTSATNNTGKGKARVVLSPSDGIVNATALGKACLYTSHFWDSFQDVVQLVEDLGFPLDMKAASRGLGSPTEVIYYQQVNPGVREEVALRVNSL